MLLTCSALALAGEPDISVSMGPPPGIEELFDGQPTPVDVGVTRPGDVATNMLTVHNAGDRPLILTAVAVHGASEIGTGPLVPVLLPGLSTGLLVLYTPGAAGVHDATLVLSSNDPDQAELHIPLRGQASDDTDGDGVLDLLDPCPLDGMDDEDGDGICADRESCPQDFNPDQSDTDHDGLGDACEGTECSVSYDQVKVTDLFHRPDGAPGAPWITDGAVHIQQRALCSDSAGVALLHPDPDTRIYGFVAALTFTAAGADALHLSASDSLRSIAAGCDAGPGGGCVLTVQDSAGGRVEVAPEALLAVGEDYTIHGVYADGVLSATLVDASDNELASVALGLPPLTLDTLGVVIGHDGALTCMDSVTVNLDTVYGVCSSVDADMGAVCGDGLILALPEPDCEGAAGGCRCDEVTDVWDTADLEAWQADPTTTLRVQGVLDLDGTELRLLTPCEVEIMPRGALLGAQDLIVQAASMQLRGVVDTSGEMVLILAGALEQQADGMLVAGSLQVESGGGAVLRGTTLASSMCAEAAGAIDLGAGSELDLAGDLSLHGDTVLMGGSVRAASLSAWTPGDLEVSSTATTRVEEDVTLQIGGAVDLRGRLRLEGGVMLLDADELTVEPSASITDVGALSVYASRIDWRGALESTDLVDLRTSGDFNLALSARIRGNGDIGLVAEGLFESSGRIQGNGEVSITSGVWKLNATSSLRDNAACTLTGDRHARSRAPRGCVAL